jgi:hypothetical protein
MTNSDTPQGQDNTANETRNSDQGCYHAYHKTKPAKWWHRIDWSQVVLDGLLLLVGIKLAVIYTGQLSQMIESNRISRESLESVQRAFVGVTAPLFDRQGIVGPGKTSTPVIRVRGVMDNEGTTEAEDVVSNISSAMLKDEPTEDQFLAQQYGPIITVTTIAPKGHRDTGVLEWKESDVFGDMLSNPSKAKPMSTYLFVWGWVAYHDVFKNTKMHITEYCRGLSRTYVPADNKSGPQLTFTDCHKHNCDDEHCSDYQTIVKQANALVK